MSQVIWVQYPDSTKSKIIGFAGLAEPIDQDKYVGVVFGETTTSDPLYAIYYAAQGWIQHIGLPAPTTD